MFVWKALGQYYYVSTSKFLSSLDISVNTICCRLINFLLFSLHIYFLKLWLFSIAIIGLQKLVFPFAQSSNMNCFKCMLKSNCAWGYKKERNEWIIKKQGTFLLNILIDVKLCAVCCSKQRFFFSVESFFFSYILMYVNILLSSYILAYI